MITKVSKKILTAKKMVQKWSKNTAKNGPKILQKSSSIFQNGPMIHFENWINQINNVDLKMT